jgi:hypothetical protein
MLFYLYWPFGNIYYRKKQYKLHACGARCSVSKQGTGSEYNQGGDKIEESACSVFCLQETKKEHSDQQFVRKFAPRRYDSFDFVSFVGASGAY